MPEVILVVDDDPSLRESLALLLDDEGFPVRTAQDGADALAHLARERAALIISDFMMPVIDGITLVDELRRRGDRTPVVLMSAADLRDPIASGPPGVRIILKPLDIDDLLTVVRESLTDDLHVS